jgi:hypothetical protein
LEGDEAKLLRFSGLEIGKAKSKSKSNKKLHHPDIALIMSRIKQNRGTPY